MTQQLRVRLVQRASGLDPTENRATLDDVAADLPDETDLVVLPEAFARDFGSPVPSSARTQNRWTGHSRTTSAS